MKIIFIATPNSQGHHYSYFNQLSMLSTNSTLITEQNCPNISCKQYALGQNCFGTKSLVTYLKLICYFRKIIKHEQPDLVHIQCGDNFYRFFGLGLNYLSCKNIIMTFHHMKRSFFRDISLKLIFKKIQCGVVHTQKLQEMLYTMGIQNVKHIEYPSFHNLKLETTTDAKKYFGINKNLMCFGAIGGTRFDKGLDLLLKSLTEVKLPFQLLIAGSESDITREHIETMIQPYKANVTLFLKYLTDDELKLALNAVDAIVLPYRNEFDGASGPLGEGVCLDKIIIGPSHGSLGEIITKNHLGYVFETENVANLSETLTRCLQTPFVFDEKYRSYKELLNPEKFVSEYEKCFKDLYI